MCSVLCVAYCQRDTQEQKTNPAKKPKSNKPKVVKSTNKGPRAAKPKIKATPAAPAQTFLTQVFHVVYIHSLLKKH